MSDSIQPPVHRDGLGDDHSQPDAPNAARHGLGQKAWMIFKAVQARLRFIVILAAIGAVIGYWDTLVAHYEKWTRPRASVLEHSGSDVEFFCPMHPEIVRDRPGEKCPLCFMPLSRRTKSDAPP